MQIALSQRSQVLTAIAFACVIAGCQKKAADAPQAPPNTPTPAADVETPEPAKPEPAKPEPAKPEPAKPEPAKPEPAKPEPAAESKTLEGVLAYKPLPTTKSVAAYMGVEFTLATDNDPVALTTGAVSRDTLITASGKRVRVVCVLATARAPSPHESAPLGIDGKPVPRPAKCQVNELTLLEPPPAPPAPAAVAPWTAKSAQAALESAPEDDDMAQLGNTISGWNLETGAYGECTWTCASRNDNHEIDCIGGTVGKAGFAPLTSMSLTQWAAMGLMPLTSRVPPGTFEAGAVQVAALGAESDELEVEGQEMIENLGCVWTLALVKGDTQTPVLTGHDECFSEPTPSLVRSPDGGLGATTTAFSGDHGCGEFSGAVFRIPDGLANAAIAAGLKHHKKSPDKALAFYEAALQVYPESQKGRYNRACSHALQGHTALAAADVKELLQIDRATWLPHISGEKDLDAIRDTPEMKAALAAAE